MVQKDPEVYLIKFRAMLNLVIMIMQLKLLSIVKIVMVNISIGILLSQILQIIRTFIKY